MSSDDQGQTGGFSAYEMALLVRGLLIALTALLLALWLSGVFDADGPAWLSFGVILGGLFSFIVAAAISIMSESVVEDIIKLVLIGGIWLFWRDYELWGLILQGPTVGATVAFLGNRLR